MRGIPSSAVPHRASAEREATQIVKSSPTKTNGVPEDRTARVRSTWLSSVLQRVDIDDKRHTSFKIDASSHNLSQFGRCRRLGPSREALARYGKHAYVVGR